MPKKTIEKLKIHLDPGSSHMGSFEKAKELTNIAAGVGADAIKWQLFPKKMEGENICLPYEWLPDLVEYGQKKKIEVYASVFDQEAFDLVRQHCKRIKFSHSRRNFQEYHENPKDMIVHVSYTVMDKQCTDENIVPLFCLPVYPVFYMISFEGIFNGRFKGFSDHSLSYNQTLEAIEWGAKIIEKHFCLDSSDCPDAQFALKPKELETMMKAIANG